MSVVAWFLERTACALVPRRAAFALCWAACTSLLAAQSAIEPRGIAGSRVIVGGGKVPEAAIARFVELAGGRSARILIVPTASARADEGKERDELVALWQKRAPDAMVSVLHTRDRQVADSEEFCAPLRSATAVWFGGGAQKRIAEVWVGTRAERALDELLARGGVVGGTSAGAAIQSRTMIQEGNPDPVISRGLDLVPRAIIDQHFGQRSRKGRLVTALERNPGHFGMGIDEGTAVELTGRRIAVHGAGAVHLMLAAGGGRDERIVDLRVGDTGDLVTWQRAALDRARAASIGNRPSKLEKGSLVLAGDGRLPEAVVRRFVELAGGHAARVVIVDASPEERRAVDSFAATLERAGVRNVRTIVCRHPSEVDEASRAAIAEATAVWLGDGRPWQFVDALEGTTMPEDFAKVLERGGVIGGAAAGAALQGESMIRSDPLGKDEAFCEGYDRGFAFLPGVVIDCASKKDARIDGLSGLIGMRPNVVGLAIDEATAAVVQSGMLEVIGDATVSVIDVRSAAPEEQSTRQPIVIRPGERWDLVLGKRWASGEAR